MAVFFAENTVAIPGDLDSRGGTGLFTSGVFSGSSWVETLSVSERKLAIVKTPEWSDVRF